MDSVDAIFAASKSETKPEMGSPSCPVEGSSKVVIGAGETKSVEPSSGTAVGEVGGATTPTSPTVAGSSTLNPLAMEWDPSIKKALEDERCLYLTFSNGYPLTEFEISSFFTENFGAIVETVYIHKPNLDANHQKEYPLFGRVIFDSLYMTSLILGGSDQRKFVINERTLWCKKFIPKAVRKVQGA